MAQLKKFILVIFVIKWVRNEEIREKKFPDDFLFGVASSAYQIEGGHNLNGKGVNIWDYYTQLNPNFVDNSSNGNEACDSYHKYKEDVKQVKDLGVQFYRFSISWTRILPNGFANKINTDGLNYYNNLINELISNGIRPMVTIYHWDLPKKLQDLGGWTNPLIVNYYEDYARILFSNFGDRVKYWITFNSACVGYGDNNHPPMLNEPGIANYLCTHVTLLAHAKVYHLYDNEFRSSQNGRIGLTIDGRWFEPATNSPENIEAAERAREFVVGNYGNPIFHADGDYPAVMKRRVAEMSRNEGFTKSRLPNFSPQEIQYIQGTYDFLGINVYTTFLVQDIPEIQSETPSITKDIRARMFQDEQWPKSNSNWLKVEPTGVRKILNWIKNKYDDPEIIITENGYSDEGEINDIKRIKYYQQYLSSLLDAIDKDNVTVKGYAAWSLMDNFEWLQGYSAKFGLYHVDFSDPDRKRTPKKSAKWYKKVVKQRKIVEISEENTRFKTDL